VGSKLDLPPLLVLGVVLDLEPLPSGDVFGLQVDHNAGDRQKPSPQID
jgi:hypothetical protein